MVFDKPGIDIPIRFRHSARDADVSRRPTADPPPGPGHISEIERKMSGTINFAIGHQNHTPYTGIKAPASKYLVPRTVLPVSAASVSLWTWRALTHIKQVREVLTLIAGVPLYSTMVQGDPRFAYKFLTDDYLARGFSISERASCFIHHYKRLRDHFPSRLLRQIMHDEVTLHDLLDVDSRFALTMGLSHPYDNEGELSLRLRVEGDIVFVLSFTIVPGWVVNSQAAEAILITRLQGIKGCYRQISDATRALHDVGPAQLLLSALQGVSAAFGICAIAAVSADRQTSYKKAADRDFKQAYDHFFAGLGLLKSAAGFFSSEVPIDQKPLKSIKRGHKLRTKEKRAFKHRIQMDCAAFFAGFGPVSPHRLDS